MSSIIVHTDGGARGNPGPAAIGVVIEAEGVLTREIGETIGNTTNNQAEYQAVLRACEEVQRMPDITKADFYLDSELVVKQLNGLYKVKDGLLRPHYEAIKAFMAEVPYSVTFTHIPRAQNGRADFLVNQALDHAENNQSVSLA